jgi:hypothetical protein
LPRGLQTLRVLRRNLLVKSELSRATRVRDEATQRVASSWLFLGPHREDPMPLTFVSKSRLGGFLHTPPCGLTPSRSSFPQRITQERCLKPPSPDLMGGGGARGISPCLIQLRGACPGWLSPPYSDPGSTQILTRHHGAKSQTVSQLTNSGTAPTSMPQLFSHWGSSKHLRMR